ncbi:MAG: PepSY-associated TM helix domain-containing protein [Akkermansiaceae bacterium]|nr:PepSY-associated TM helix domain-containing protein [Akkermansiaceae bacterium]
MNTKTLWKWHAWMGLIAGLPLLVIAISGSILVFKDEIDSLLIPELMRVEVPAGADPLPLEERLAVLQRELPDHEVTGWAFYPEPDRADFVYLMEHGDSEWLHVFQNPYTGQLLSQPAASESRLTGWVLSLHYELLAGHTGLLVCGLLGVVLCLLGISGLLIYRRFWASFFTLRWRSSLRLLSGNLHKRIGLVSAPVFLILGITGAWWNLSHIVEEIQHVTSGEEHEVAMQERLYRSDLPLDELAAKTKGALPGLRINYLSFPWEPGVPLTFFGDFEDDGALRSPYHSTASFDAQTAEPLGHQHIRDASAFRQTLDTFGPLHYGTFGGLATRILWCILGSAPAFLALSGFVVWWKRRQ